MSVPFIKRLRTQHIMIGAARPILIYMGFRNMLQFRIDRCLCLVEGSCDLGDGRADIRKYRCLQKYIVYTAHRFIIDICHYDIVVFPIPLQPFREHLSRIVNRLMNALVARISCTRQVCRN